MGRDLKEISIGMWKSRNGLLDHKLWSVKDRAPKFKYCIVKLVGEPFWCIPLIQRGRSVEQIKENQETNNIK